MDSPLPVYKAQRRRNQASILLVAAAIKYNEPLIRKFVRWDKEIWVIS